MSTTNIVHESVQTDSADAQNDLVEEDNLIEEVSIDGMCGVY